MNILVYNGAGTTPGSVKHAVETLRGLLEPYYAVNTIGPRALEVEPWQSKTKAVIFPGGADLPYIRACKNVIPLLRDFIDRDGGIYIGFCAGAYFGSSRVEFCKGDSSMEVTGPRDLQFFPGITRGPAFKGFQYNSEVGAKAVRLRLEDNSEVFNYFNGGPVFVDADTFDNVEVLAHYSDPVDVPYSDTSNCNSSASLAAAVVLCNCGRGKALLAGSHPEFIPRILEKTATETKFPLDVLNTLKKNDKDRLSFMRHILAKVGLRINDNPYPDVLPSLSPLLMMTRPGSESKIDEFEREVEGLTKDSHQGNGKRIFSGGNNEFEVLKGFRKTYAGAQRQLENRGLEDIVLPIILPEIDGVPTAGSEITPNFDADLYFRGLNKSSSLGSVLLYGEVVSSTSTLLNNNPKLLSCFPENSVLHVASVQVSGKGRGNNVWVSPKGVCASTVVVSLPLRTTISNENISIAFVQYLAMLAYCKAITTYGNGFEDIPVRIKWPNDLYIMDPTYYYKKRLRLLNKFSNDTSGSLTDIETAYVKVAGLLVNTHFIGNKYTLLLGCGLNLTNDGPTTSLQKWVDIINEERAAANISMLPNFRPERLLSLYMNHLDDLLKNFISFGARAILPEYYEYWLHTNQVVTLQDHGGIRVKIVGITEDYGLLIAKELVPGSNTLETGATYHLQPDGNTFDMFRGLIARRQVGV